VTASAKLLVLVLLPLILHLSWVHVVRSQPEGHPVVDALVEVGLVVISGGLVAEPVVDRGDYRGVNKEGGVLTELGDLLARELGVVLWARKGLDEAGRRGLHPAPVHAGAVVLEGVLIPRLGLELLAELLGELLSEVPSGEAEQIRAHLVDERLDVGAELEAERVEVDLRAAVLLGVEGAALLDDLGLELLHRVPPERGDQFDPPLRRLDLRLVLGVGVWDELHGAVGLQGRAELGVVRHVQGLQIRQVLPLIQLLLVGELVEQGRPALLLKPDRRPFLALSAVLHLPLLDSAGLELRLPGGVCEGDRLALQERPLRGVSLWNRSLVQDPGLQGIDDLRCVLEGLPVANDSPQLTGGASSDLERSGTLRWRLVDRAGVAVLARLGEVLVDGLAAVQHGKGAVLADDRTGEAVHDWGRLLSVQADDVPGGAARRLDASEEAPPPLLVLAELGPEAQGARKQAQQHLSGMHDEVLGVGDEGEAATLPLQEVGEALRNGALVCEAPLQVEAAGGAPQSLGALRVEVEAGGQWHQRVGSEEVGLLGRGLAVGVEHEQDVQELRLRQGREVVAEVRRGALPGLSLAGLEAVDVAGALPLSVLQHLLLARLPAGRLRAVDWPHAHHPGGERRVQADVLEQAQAGVDDLLADDQLEALPGPAVHAPGLPRGGGEELQELGDGALVLELELSGVPGVDLVQHRNRCHGHGLDLPVVGPGVLGAGHGLEGLAQQHGEVGIEALGEGLVLPRRSLLVRAERWVGCPLPLAARPDATEGEDLAALAEGQAWGGEPVPERVVERLPAHVVHQEPQLPPNAQEAAQEIAVGHRLVRASEADELGANAGEGEVVALVSLAQAGERRHDLFPAAEALFGQLRSRHCRSELHQQLVALVHLGVRGEEAHLLQAVDVDLVPALRGVGHDLPALRLAEAQVLGQVPDRVRSEALHARQCPVLRVDEVEPEGEVEAEEERVQARDLVLLPPGLLVERGEQGVAGLPPERVLAGVEEVDVGPHEVEADPEVMLPLGRGVALVQVRVFGLPAAEDGVVAAQGAEALAPEIRWPVPEGAAGHLHEDRLAAPGARVGDPAPVAAAGAARALQAVAQRWVPERLEVGHEAAELLLDLQPRGEVRAGHRGGLPEEVEDLHGCARGRVVQHDEGGVLLDVAHPLERKLDQPLVLVEPRQHRIVHHVLVVPLEAPILGEVGPEGGVERLVQAAVRMYLRHAEGRLVEEVLGWKASACECGRGLKGHFVAGPLGDACESVLVDVAERTRV